MVPEAPRRDDSSQDETLLERSPTAANLSPDQLEETLRQTESDLAWYRALYESIPLIYFTLNSDGVVLAVNDLGAARLGYTALELTEKLIFELFHPEDQASLQEAIAAFLNSSLFTPSH